nr:hypothetical protein GCM10020093_099130 [Planobispora longispora]
MIEGGGALLAVSDAGIGMTGEELVEINRRLADPPVVDVSVSRRMGLFVVGRLALRHGIRVQLRPQEAGGLIAMVLFPPEIIVQAAQQVPTPRGAPTRPPRRAPSDRTRSRAARSGRTPWRAVRSGRTPSSAAPSGRTPSPTTPSPRPPSGRTLFR